MRLYTTAAACLSLVAHVTAATSFSDQVEEILSRPTFADATIGIDVRERESGTLVYERDATEPLVPASNQKLLVSTVALSDLGADFTYTTTVFGTSDVGDDGVLDGDVWIVGSGDPSLKSERLAEIASELVAQTGLKSITGSVYGDGTAFDGKFLGKGWSESDESFYYSAQVAGLNCDINVVNVSVAPGAKKGAAAVVKVNGLGVAEEEYVEIESTIKTTSRGGTGSGSFERRKGTNTIVLSGSIPLGSDPFNFVVTIHDPNSFTAYRFALALDGAGVEVSKTPTESGSLPAGATELASSTSAPLSQILKEMNKPSDNMYAEALLKTISLAVELDEPGNSAAGAEAVSAFLEREGLDSTAVSMVDGSGLSHLNTLTARFVSDLLLYNRDEFSEEDWQFYFDSLPIGGVDGTLSGRFVGMPLEGGIRAKTGSLTGVSALSGYVTGEDGTEYVMSVLMNGHTSTTSARKAQDDIALALYHYTAN